MIKLIVILITALACLLSVEALLPHQGMTGSLSIKWQIVNIHHFRGQIISSLDSSSDQRSVSAQMHNASIPGHIVWLKLQHYITVSKYFWDANILTSTSIDYLNFLFSLQAVDIN